MGLNQNNVSIGFPINNAIVIASFVVAAFIATAINPSYLDLDATFAFAYVVVPSFVILPFAFASITHL